ncbi:MAG: LptA/OstA family protein [Thermodesulfovibrionia bacterium]
MSKAFFTFRNVLKISKKIQKSLCNHLENHCNQESSKRVFWSSLLLFLSLLCFLVTPTPAAKEKPIVITSKTLIIDNKNKTAIFEGSVVAKSEDIIIYSDKMEVFYNESQEEITKIHVYGNVRVLSKERAIFSNEATYLGREEKIIFSGEPKAVDGENVITGTQIIYFLKDDRTIVEGGRIILKPKNRE